MNKGMLCSLSAACLLLTSPARSDEKPIAKAQTNIRHHQGRNPPPPRRVDDQYEDEGEYEDDPPQAAPARRPPAPRTHGPKKRIGIVDFDDVSHTRWGHGQGALAEAARDAATEALVNSGSFVVIEREQLAAVLHEQGLGMTGIISPQTAAKAGKLMGLQAIVTGKITDFGVKDARGGFGGFYQSHTKTYRARVSLRMVDATSGEIWVAESGEGTSSEKSAVVMGGGAITEDELLGKKALYQAIHQMIGRLVAKADSKPWVGTVAKVGKDKKIYITAGSSIGLPAGATLSVSRLGEAITDPSTGQIIGHEVGANLGSIQVAQHVNEKLSVCIPVKGAGFQIGDRVTLSGSRLAVAADTDDY